MKRRHRDLLRRLARLVLQNPTQAEEGIRYIIQYVEENFAGSCTEYLQYYRDQVKKENKYRKVVIESGGPVDISASQIKEVVGWDQDFLPSIEVRHNPDLIAGFRLRYRDWVWDTSIASDLEQLLKVLL
jgi:F0F1-type ATP synthase delta subunit